MQPWKLFPISALIFGGRLSRTFPLVFEARDWEHGVFMAASMGSEATAAAFSQAAIRRDPFAMLPFAGYHMADYWKHWLGMGSKPVRLPRIFRVNWFRKDDEGRFLWPGYGQNMRIIHWVIRRIHDGAGAVEGPFGLMPRYGDLRWEGLDFGAQQFSDAMEVRREDLMAEARDLKDYFAAFGGRLPAAIEEQRRLLEERAAQAPASWRPPA